jgi:predicted metal-dependent phosphoesterase TrpH
VTTPTGAHTSAAATTGAAEFVDLQVHTTASDGALPPVEVVEAAKQAGLVAIAITDHDTIEGLAAASEAGARLGVRIVPGVELSTYFGTSELHLLGLHLSDTDAIRDALTRFQADRIARAGQIVATLNKLGIPVTVEAVLREAGNGAVGRPHVARAMMAGGWAKDFREAFDKWLGWGRPGFVEKPRFDVADGIALVHRAGGLAVWAHPGEVATPDRVGTLAALGLDAVEVLHPSHPPYLVQKLFAVTESAGLLPSGGSDWHGTHDGPRRLGGQLVPRTWLDWMDAKVAARHALSATSR